jgi:predicted nucleotidyltransferase
MKADHFSTDIQDLLFLLDKHQVRYVIVGGEAVIYHGHARLTGDVDIFYESLPENVNALFAALMEFWENSIPGLGHPDELLEPGLILQFGVPPNRIDLINRIENVSFMDAWNGKVSEEMTIRRRTVVVHFIGLDQLIRNKEALDRPKDLEDLKYLKRAKKDMK